MFAFIQYFLIYVKVYKSIPTIDRSSMGYGSIGTGAPRLIIAYPIINSIKSLGTTKAMIYIIKYNS